MRQKCRATLMSVYLRFFFFLWCGGIYRVVRGIQLQYPWCRNFHSDLFIYPPKNDPQMDIRRRRKREGSFGESGPYRPRLSTIHPPEPNHLARILGKRHTKFDYDPPGVSYREGVYECYGKKEFCEIHIYTGYMGLLLSYLFGQESLWKSFEMDYYGMRPEFWVYRALLLLNDDDRRRRR